MWMQSANLRMLDAVVGDSYGMLEEHLFETPLLILEIWVESVEEERQILDLPVLFDLLDAGSGSLGVSVVAGLQHLHTSLVLEPQESGEALLPFVTVGNNLLLHLLAFLLDRPHTVRLTLVIVH